MLQLIPLGVSGWIPTSERSTSALLCTNQKHLILLDAGTGLHKLRDYTELLDNFDTIHIILSHYHLDHIIGLSYLPRYVQDKKLHIYGPGKPYYSQECKEILTQFTSPPFFARTIDRFAKEVHFHNYTTAGFQIDDLQIGITPQKHSHPSFGITLGTYLHYATDTMVMKESFQKRVQLLLHECWNTQKEGTEGHSSLEEIQEFALKSAIPKIGLIHLNPFYMEAQLQKWQSNKIFLLRENKEITL